MMPLSTPIRMEDGGTKALADVAVGDRVRDDLFGYVNIVTGLERCLYGQQFTDGVLRRRMFEINGALRLTGTHHIRALDSWAMVELDVYDAFVRHRPMEGTVETDTGLETVPYLPLSVSRIVPFGPALPILLPHIDQPTGVLSSVFEVTDEYAPEAELGALRVDGSHIIEAAGFFVGGWPHDDDFDYEAGEPR